jgi:LytS/YehU family sensor histidine kinase
VGSIFIVFIFTIFMAAISHFFNMKPRGETVFFPKMFFMLVTAIVITAMTLLLTILFYISKEREKNIVEIQKLSVENMRSRYETLKSKINPHFLFNSLNTLNGLIGIDNDKAKEYVFQLSSVFRYSVQNKEVTTLGDELVFTEAFCHLVKIRYGESLVIESRIDDKYRSCTIMPLSLQTLVENAIKHNTISNRYPLTITIETTDNGTIRVSNKIQPKSEDTSGEGIGLANLSERYKMLYQKEVTISNANGIFSVEIPLINNGK